ncbi:hypothetical protein [Flavobacterium sp. 25HG05S-40]
MSTTIELKQTPVAHHNKMTKTVTITAMKYCVVESKILNGVIIKTNLFLS